MSVVTDLHCMKYMAWRQEPTISLVVLMLHSQVRTVTPLASHFRYSTHLDFIYIFQ